MKSKYFALKFACLITSLIAENVRAASWQGSFSVGNISIEGSYQEPVAYISVSPGVTTSCGDSGYATLFVGTALGKNALASLLTATALQRKVWIRIEDTCYGNRAIISGINLLNQ